MTITHWYKKIKYPIYKDEQGPEQLKNFLEMCGEGYLKGVRDFMEKHDKDGDWKYANDIINTDGVCRDAACWRETRENLISTGDTILNIGSNAGFHTFKMKRQGYEPTGLEPSQLLVDFATNELKPVLDQELYGDVNFFHGIEREALEIFGEKSFDIIFTKHVFEHLEEPVGALQRWKKLARKGIAGIVPAEPRVEKRGNAQHLFRYSEKVLKRLIEEQGYKNVGTCSFTASGNVKADPTITCTSIGYWASV